MLCLRVYGYQIKVGRWAAHCLETDLVGYGRNFNAALKELQELTEMQISFAVFKNQPALLDRPAPPEIFEMYSNNVRSILQRFTIGTRDKKHRVASIPWPTDLSRVDTAFVPA